MKPATAPLWISSTYATVACFAFATTAAETMLLYPNIFHDIPDSLALTQQFMGTVAVGDIMRPLGGLLTLCALPAAYIAVRHRTARAWTASSLAFMITGQFLLSILYQWPRATILFDDRDQHTRAEIDRAATEFLIGQGFRIAAGLAAAILATAAALIWYRARVLADAGRPAPRSQLA
ncbi:hypothetical protein OHB26_37045 [Nocardia sp. NBC_01503]|uniref:hypothetical protein n=1 Tax=Nocardia sp. NBC_01503 TaxID=2975997 RepID=UPI002E7B5662|nr:hypothetical protein [Nocardia sp. NBC_01503]WTL32406.1 hypothetical protein OHB26_37045 [Nocardia sp. NBC_01503]